MNLYFSIDIIICIPSQYLAYYLGNTIATFPHTQKGRSRKTCNLTTISLIRKENDISLAIYRYLYMAYIGDLVYGRMKVSKKRHSRYKFCSLNFMRFTQYIGNSIVCL